MTSISVGKPSDVGSHAVILKGKIQNGKKKMSKQNNPVLNKAVISTQSYKCGWKRFHPTNATHSIYGEIHTFSGFSLLAMAATRLCNIM